MAIMTINCFVILAIVENSPCVGVATPPPPFLIRNTVKKGVPPSRTERRLCITGKSCGSDSNTLASRNLRRRSSLWRTTRRGSGERRKFASGVVESDIPDSSRARRIRVARCGRRRGSLEGLNQVCHSLVVPRACHQSIPLACGLQQAHRHPWAIA